MTAPFPLPNVILSRTRGGHPRDILRHLTEALELAEGVDGTALMSALMRAESIGGSAIGDGVAVVSVRVPVSVSAKRLCAFATTARPVHFRGVQMHPCDLVYVLVSPDDQSQAHLRDLSAVIRTLRDRDFLERLRAAHGADRMMSLFRARDLATFKAA